MHKGSNKSAISRSWLAGLVMMLLLSMLGPFPAPARADDAPLDLVLGGTAATPWVMYNIKPGSGGTETVELHNAGSRDGFVTIWLSDIVSSEGTNPESETGDTEEPGELDNYLRLEATSAKIVSNIEMPAKLGDLPSSYRSGNFIEVMPLKAGATVSVDWHWELPAGTGNDAQGDVVYFTVNYLLRECEISDVSGVTDAGGTFTDEVTIESDTARGTLTIAQDTTGRTGEGQPVSEVWLIEMDKQPPSEVADETIVSLWDAGPDGTTFDRPITITLGYDDPEDIPAGSREADLYIALWDETTRQWEKLDGCVVDTVNNTISVQISHFSRYSVVAPDAQSGPVVGGGGGGSASKPKPEPEPEEPEEPPLPPVGVLPGATLEVDMLGRQSTVAIGLDGTLNEAVVLGDAEAGITLELTGNSRIIGEDGLLPERLEILELAEIPAELTAAGLPENLVLLSPAYRLLGYADGVEISHLYFEPAALLSVSYDTENLPENVLAPFIAIIEPDGSLSPVGLPAGALFRTGTALAALGHTATFVVAAEVVPPELPLPAEFLLGNLTVSPSVSYTTEPVEIGFSVTNRGETTGSYELYLKIDGIVQQIIQGTLEPGESRELSFGVTDLGEGSHEVRVGSLAGSIEVVRQEPAPEPGVNWLPLDIGIGTAVLVSLLVLLFLLRKYRGKPGG